MPERLALAPQTKKPYPAGMRISRMLAVLAPLALTTLASAQALKPPDPTFTPKPGPVVGYLMMGVLFAIIVAVSLMPSKRSHTDL